jgi:hypothetical protein
MALVAWIFPQVGARTKIKMSRNPYVCRFSATKRFAIVVSINVFHISLFNQLTSLKFLILSQDGSGNP